MLYALILLQLADIATTHYALRTGIGTEANPVLRKLFDRFGHEPVLLAIKGAFIALLWWAAPLVPVEVLWVLAAFYVWVVGSNLKLILRAKKEN
jgi:hypothetical protein